METYELIFAIIIGLLLLLAGYRIKKITFFIAWFIIGYYIMETYLLGIINNAVPQIANDAIYQNLLPLAGGVLMGCLGFTLEKLCVFWYRRDHASSRPSNWCNFSWRSYCFNETCLHRGNFRNGRISSNDCSYRPCHCYRFKPILLLDFDCASCDRHHHSILHN